MAPEDRSYPSYIKTYSHDIIFSLISCLVNFIDICCIRDFLYGHRRYKNLEKSNKKKRQVYRHIYIYIYTYIHIYTFFFLFFNFFSFMWTIYFFRLHTILPHSLRWSLDLYLVPQEACLRSQYFNILEVFINSIFISIYLYNFNF